MSTADLARQGVEYLRILISWPVVAVFALFLFRKEVRALLNGINKANAFGVSIELGERLANEAKPSATDSFAGQTTIDMSVSSGGYSRDYRALFVVVGLANRSGQPDQVIKWKITFESLNLELEPTSAPPNLVGGVPWWSSPMVKLPPDELVQGTLFFRGTGPLAEGLPAEPLRGKLFAETLHGKQLSQQVQVYSLATLQAKAASG